MREKIRKLQEELAWDAAEDEAKVQKTELEEQSEAYSDYEEEYQKYLDDFLEDANNFSDEVNTVLGMNQEELLKWLAENVEEYRNSLAASQESLLQSWTDTFKKMRGIVDLYWNQIAQTLISKDVFMEYMKSSAEYVNASEDERKQLEFKWENMYDDWVNSIKIAQEAIDYEHSDEFETGNGSNTNNGGSGGRKNDPADDGKDSFFSSLAGALGVGLLGNDIIQLLANIEHPQLGPPDNQFHVYEKDLPHFASGGLVDFTGPAWVDGTPSNPESFLDAQDTALIQSMLDYWEHTHVGLPALDVSGVLPKTQPSYGDVHITINEASLANDADLNEVARQVGDVFTRELSKQGFRTSILNF